MESVHLGCSTVSERSSLSSSTVWSYSGSRLRVWACSFPLELNVPLVVGGAINWFVTTRSKDAEVNKARGEKGTLIASGFIAGGALMGVVSALLKFGGLELSIAESWWTNPLSEICSLVAYILLIAYFIRATKK
jgi:cell division protein FtsX